MAEKERWIEKIFRTTGIWLQNLKRRLELLYPQRHRLEIQDEAEAFKVKLEVDI